MRREHPGPRVPRWYALAATAACVAATAAAPVAGTAPVASASPAAPASVAALAQQPADGPVRPAPAGPVADRDRGSRPVGGTYRLAEVVSSPVASRGDTVEYAVAVRNPSATAVRGPVVLRDTLPGGVEYVSHHVDTEPPGVRSTITLTPPGPEARTVTWSFPNGLPAHLLARLAITVTVTVQGPIEQVDRVQAVAGPRPTVAPANQCLTGPGDVEHQACAYLWIRPLADIALARRVGVTTAVPGQRVQYTSSSTTSVRSRSGTSPSPTTCPTCWTTPATTATRTPSRIAERSNATDTTWCGTAPWPRGSGSSSGSR